MAFAFASGKTAVEAAKAGGVSESTAWRRLREGDFKRRIAGLRGEMLSQATGRLAEQAGAAVDVLVGLLGSEDEDVRLKAARSVLDAAVRLRDATELSDRLDELERRINRGDTTTNHAA